MKPTRRLSTQKGIAGVTTPRTNNALVYLFISGKEKGELWIIFKINFQFSHVSCIYCNLSHMDGRLYRCFCVILIDWYWFSNAFAYFRLNRMSHSRNGLWSSGISRMPANTMKRERQVCLVNFCGIQVQFYYGISYSRTVSCRTVLLSV